MTTALQEIQIHYANVSSGKLEGYAIVTTGLAVNEVVDFVSLYAPEDFNMNGKVDGWEPSKS